MSDRAASSSPPPGSPPATAQAGAKPPPPLEAPTAYLARHGIHVVVDRLARDILREQPTDPSLWMQRWLLEEHRKRCAAKHAEHHRAASAAASGDAAAAAASADADISADASAEGLPDA